MSKFSGAFDTIIDKLDKKQSSMEVEGMKGQLGEVEKLLKGNPNWVEIVTASKLLEKIKAERAKTLIRDPEERNAIGGRIDVVKGEIAKLRTEQKGEL